MKTPWIRTRLMRLASLSALAALLLCGFVLLPAADHRDGPIFGPPGITGAGGLTNSRRDINDIYVFRSPRNANNTVLILTVSPFSTTNTPTVFDQRVTYEFNIINRNILQATDDVKLRINFSAPDKDGFQNVVLRGFPVSKFKPPTLTDPNPDPILVQGRTGRNLALTPRVGGLIRAAEQDDPFFFDAVGLARLFNNAANATPRPFPAPNFFGPNVNTLCVTIEIPSRFLVRAGSNLIGVWAAAIHNSNQIDRMGRPAINTALIPPIPRGSNFPIDNTIPNRRERRNAFNAGHPKNDRRDFKADAVAVLMNFYGRTAAQADGIANALLPDILIFDVTSTDGFTGPNNSFRDNGRRLRDDVIDAELNVLTGGTPMTPGAIPSDNVPDDNAGAPAVNAGVPIQDNFPYIGKRNQTPVGLPREGNGAPGQ